MAHLASKVHSHPMSTSTIETCFGPLYTSVGIYLDDEFRGFAILHQIFENATLMDICIEPKFQGRGLGHLLLDHVITFAREHDAETFFLEVRESSVVARALYIRDGFREAGYRKGYYKTASGTEDAILMELTL
ncbi:ribosomal protein S18-alanine N-acetyltransferase [Shewanella sp. VB17]|nr:ribosomal protein S18-alanine N-acetyltransferase [Shewanella sp. VB17]